MASSDERAGWRARLRPLALPAALAALAAGAALAADPPAGGRAEYVGGDTCLGCHADRAAFNRSVHGMALPRAKGIPAERSCETCHGPGSLHAAAAGDKSNPGYHTIRTLGSLKGAAASEGCLSCHSGGKRMHWHGSTHDMKDISCLDCHGIHAEKVNRGRAPLLKAAGEAESCYKCHAEKRAQIRKSGHMPLVEGKMGCSSCHNPHGSSADKLMSRNTVPETCYQCHQDKRGPFMWDHAPARENCSTCHDPHGSHNEKMLVTRSPMLCQRCHVGGRHPGTAYGASASDIQSNRLMYKGCVNCHPQVHGTNHPSGKFLIR